MKNIHRQENTILYPVPLYWAFSTRENEIGHGRQAIKNELMLERLCCTAMSISMAVVRSIKKVNG